ncbi:ribonuclease H-like domain-containing protein [Tanacetum coccineum]
MAYIEEISKDAKIIKIEDQLLVLIKRQVETELMLKEKFRDLCEEVSKFVKESEDVVKEVGRLSCKDVGKETVRLLRRGQKHDFDLSEDVYMHQPPGFVDARFSSAEANTVVFAIVCRRGLHGLANYCVTFRPLSTATLVYCDNVSVVYMSANPVQHQRTKHIEIDIHFIRDIVTHGQVRVLHVPSRYQYADIFTKGLPSALFEELRLQFERQTCYRSNCGGCLVLILSLISAANTRGLFDGMLVYCDRENAKDLEFANALHNLWAELLERTNERRLFITELEGLCPFGQSYIEPSGCQSPVVELAAAGNSNNSNDAISVYIQREINVDLQFAVGLSQMWDVLYNRVNEMKMLAFELYLFSGPLAV